MDWQANYVARLAEDGRTLDLFAWLTLTNSNDESFPAAMVNAIAGQLAASPVAVIAQQEELGDLKLYRIPEPVTVAANGQKQVALLNREKVKADNLYSLRLPADSEEEDWRPVELMLRTRNNKDKGLGLPLPAGSVPSSS